jgi:hypothetical protein
MGQVTSNVMIESIDCTSPLSTCATLDTLFGGVVGTCNITSKICQCPLGYDGDDLWAFWNDCHVNVLTRTAVEYTATALAALCFVACVLGMTRLLIIWKILYWSDHNDFSTASQDQLGETPPPRTAGNQIVVSNETIPLANEPVREKSSPSAPVPKRRNTLQNLVPNVDLSEIQRPRTNARTNTFQQMVAERKRRRNTLGLILTWLFFSLFTLAFQIYRHLGFRFEQRVPFMLFCLPGIMTFALLGLWSLTYTWFSNLPSLRAFAAMFPSIRGNILVKYPHLVRNFTILNCIGVAITSWTLFFVLPMIDASYINPFLIKLTLGIFALQVAIFTCTHLSVCLVLLKLFRTFNKSTSPTATGEPTINSTSQVKFSEAELTVKVMLGLTLIAGPGFTAVILAGAFSPQVYHHFYFFFSFIFCGGANCGLVITYIFVFRMGSNQGSRRRGSSSSPNIATQKSFKKASIGEGQLSPISELTKLE